MNSKLLEKIYSGGIKILLFVIPFLSLLVTQSMFFPFITGRNFVFRILIEIALVLWAGLLILKKEYRPRFSFLSGALLTFLAVVGLADAFGIFPFKAFWSNYERMEGFITLLHLGAYFLMLSSVFKSKKEWLKFLNIFVLAGALVAFYGLFQKLGWVEVFQPGFRVRPPSTIGNPSYLAAYLILIATLSLYLLFEKESFGFSKLRRIFNYAYGGIAALSLVLVYITGTRGAFLGILAGIFLFSVIYLWLVRKDKNVARRLKIILLALIILAVLIPSGLFLMKNTGFVKNSPLLERYASISLQEGQSRFLIWNMAIQGFKERPILGWGQGGFLYVFSKYYSPEMFNQEPWFDRAHNVIFDWLVNAGILGVLSYLTLLGGAIFIFSKLYKRGAVSRKSFIIIIVGLFAYFVQNLFVFDNLNTYLAFFAILAYGHGLYVLPKRSVSNEGDQNISKSLVTGLAALIVITPIIYVANVKPIKQSLTLIDAIQIAETRTADGLKALPLNPEIAKKAADKFEEALAYNTFGYSETIEQANQAGISLMRNPTNLKQAHFDLISKSLKGLENYLARFPDDVRMRLFAANAYNSFTALNSQFAELGFEHIKKVLELNPKRQLALFVLAENYLIRGDSKKAVETARKAVDLDPRFENAWATLGRIAVFARSYDDIQEIIDKNKDSVAVLEQIGNSFMAIKDSKRAAVVFEGLNKRFPENSSYLARLADIYLQLGRPDAALAVAKILAARDDSYYSQRAKLFIQKIKEEQKSANAGQ